MIDCQKAIMKGICRNDCCGCVTMNREIFERNIDKVQVKIKELINKNEDVFPNTYDNMCVFLNREKRVCEIYFDRPEICHRFGTGIDQDEKENVLLYCPHFKPNGNLWSDAKRKHLDRRVRQVTEEFLKQMGREYGKNPQKQN